jgi:hypothetical protein
MAKGLLGVGRVQKEQAMKGMLSSARIEAQQDIARQGLKQQKKLAQSQTAGTLAGAGAVVGYGALGVSEGIKVGGSVGGPAGAAVGAAIGFLVSKLFG